MDSSQTFVEGKKPNWKNRLRARYYNVVDKHVPIPRSVFYYYHILEQKKSSEVKIWLGAQVVLLFMCIIFSISASWSISEVILLFNKACFFEAQSISLVHLTNKTAGHHFYGDRIGKIEVDHRGSRFFGEARCFLTYFFPVISIILATTWIVFFFAFHCLRISWRLVFPALITITIFTITSFVVQSDIAKEGKMFIVLFKEAIKALDIEGYEDLISSVKLYVNCLWINSCCWLFADLLLIARVLTAADYRFMIVKVELVKIKPGQKLSTPPLSTSSSTESFEQELMGCNPIVTSLDTFSSDSSTDDNVKPSRVLINPIMETVDEETGLKNIVLRHSLEGKHELINQFLQDQEFENLNIMRRAEDLSNVESKRQYLETTDDSMDKISQSQQFESQIIAKRSDDVSNIESKNRSETTGESIGEISQSQPFESQNLQSYSYGVSNIESKQSTHSLLKNSESSLLSQIPYYSMQSIHNVETEANKPVEEDKKTKLVSDELETDKEPETQKLLEGKVDENTDSDSDWEDTGTIDEKIG